MKKLLYIFSIITILSSCNSDDDTPQQSNFYALTVGNSWVYKYYNYNSDTNNYDDISITKTVSILGTEEINGDTYFKFKQTTIHSDDESLNSENFYFLRDYEGNLIDETNRLLFTNSNNDEILLKNFGGDKEYFKLQDNEEEITTDVGVFNCKFGKKYRINSGESLPYLTTNIYYKDGVGLIKTKRSVTYNGEEHKSQVVLVSYTLN